MTAQSKLTLARIAWSRVLDVVKPKRDYHGKYPRIHRASPEEAKRIEEILERHRNA